jgi:S-adenosyl methyltransferase
VAGRQGQFRRRPGHRRARLEAFPQLPAAVRAGIGFRARAVRYLTGAGIRQFLDLGCGLTAGDPVHVIAQAAAPGSRVVYVDNDHCKSGCAHDRG